VVHVTGQSPSQPSPQPSPGAGRVSGPDAGGGPGNSGSPDGPRELAPRANLTTAENPWPLRLLSSKIDQYVARMSQVWVEGQVIQLSRRPGAGMAFLTLRDTDADVSMSVSIYARVLDAVLARTGAELSEGARVVIRAKPTFWTKRGSLQLQADDIRPVGVGDLLARIEQLRRILAAEGLFDAERKRPLPFLPRKVGLVCGRQAKAKDDVLVNARLRWPGLPFEVREVAVQGARAVGEVTRAIQELDTDTQIDVIVVARGGGAVEDPLPFSAQGRGRAQEGARIVGAPGSVLNTRLTGGAPIYTMLTSARPDPQSLLTGPAMPVWLASLAPVIDMLTGLVGACGWLALLAAWAGPGTGAPLHGAHWLLSAVGRRSMTVYIGQTVLFALIFGTLRLTGAPAFNEVMGASVAVAVWVALAMMCAWMERSGRTRGPLEILLRHAVAASARRR